MRCCASPRLSGSFDDTPINGALIEQLSTGAFLDSQRNIVLIGDTHTGKSHIAIGIARNIIRAGRKVRFYNAVDLVNKLETEVKLGARAASPTASRASTCSCWTSWATCYSRNRAASCCSTSVGSTSAPRSSS